MSAPYTISGTLTFPPDTGAANLPIAFSGSGQFTSRPADVLNLTGTGTEPLNLGTIPAAGAKAVLIEVDPDTNPPTKTPVIIKVNGSATGGIEIAPGGCALIHNPSPVAGITALDAVYTSANVVRYWILGD
jgi:hypothetical protein